MLGNASGRKRWHSGKGNSTGRTRVAAISGLKVRVAAGRFVPGLGRVAAPGPCGRPPLLSHGSPRSPQRCLHLISAQVLPSSAALAESGLGTASRSLVGTEALPQRGPLFRFACLPRSFYQQGSPQPEGTLFPPGAAPLIFFSSCPHTDGSTRSAQSHGVWC